MPTKPNKAGNQQNYVPAGHGDASGEYGDNDTGSNVHITFTNFKRPEFKTPEVEVQAPSETPKEEEKSRLDELGRKQKSEFANHISYWLKRGYADSKIIQELRYYRGNFGDLSGFSDEDLQKIINEFKDLKVSDEYVYFRKGNSGAWRQTRDIGKLEKSGIKYYTKEEYEQKIKSQNEDLIKNSQNKYDVAIQSQLGSKSTVVFGKGYKKEDLEEINTATKNLVTDFDGLKDYVTAMGDRTNLEKFINARRSQTELSEEQITSEINRIKKFTTFYGSDPEARYREQAISNLTGNIQLTKHQNAYAYWNPNNKMMIFMPKMKNAVESLKRDYEDNFHPTDKNISVYYHEMGHATHSMIKTYYDKLSESIKGNGDWKKYDELMNIKYDFDKNFESLRKLNYNSAYKEEFDKAFEEKFGFKNDMNAYRKMWDEKRSYDYEKSVLRQELLKKGIAEYNVSRYAATNEDEFMAECFAGHYCNANNKLCDDVFNLYSNYYKNLKEYSKKYGL